MLFVKVHWVFQSASNDSGTGKQVTPKQPKQLVVSATNDPQKRKQYIKEVYHLKQKAVSALLKALCFVAERQDFHALVKTEKNTEK